MQSKFAKAIAENIGSIAENTTRIVLIDAGLSNGQADVALSRVRCLRAVAKAKARIADILMQPGAMPEAHD